MLVGNSKNIKNRSWTNFRRFFWKDHYTVSFYNEKCACYLFRKCLQDYLIQCSKIGKSAISNMCVTISLFARLHTSKAKNNVLKFKKCWGQQCVVCQLHFFNIFCDTSSKEILRNFALFLQILERYGDVRVLKSHEVWKIFKINLKI